MILYVMRHGETDLNKNKMIQGQIDISLNKTGKKQAKDAAKVLKNLKIHFDVICSSPLQRAYNTARQAAKTLKYKKAIMLLDDFMERDFGFADRKKIEDFWPIIMKPGFKDDSYEDDEKLSKRVINAVFELEKMFKEETVLVVCHSHVIKAILNYYDSEKYTFANYFVEFAHPYQFKVSENKIELVI